MSFRIVSLYAFLAVDENGEEGLMAEKVNGTWIPFVGADQARVDLLRARVQQLAPRVTVKLVKFEPRVDVEIVNVARRTS